MLCALKRLNNLVIIQSDFTIFLLKFIHPIQSSSVSVFLWRRDAYSKKILDVQLFCDNIAVLLFLDLLAMADAEGSRLVSRSRIRLIDIVLANALSSLSCEPMSYCPWLGSLLWAYRGSSPVPPGGLGQYLDEETTGSTLWKSGATNSYKFLRGKCYWKEQVYARWFTCWLYPFVKCFLHPENCLTCPVLVPGNFIIFSVLSILGKGKLGICVLVLPSESIKYYTDDILTGRNKVDLKILLGVKTKY